MPLSQPRLYDEPIADRLQSFGRDRRFDGAVLARRTGLAGLEEMIEARQLDCLDVQVAAGPEGFGDLREVFLRGDLQVFFAVQRQNGDRKSVV